jgi:stalled ribosome rescue protein Dom34
MNKKKVVGIWMDHGHAYVVATQDGSPTGDFNLIKKISSEHHESEQYKNEKVELSKSKLELKKFFKEIEKELNDESDIFIFGPGTAQEELRNHLNESHLFRDKNIVLGSADHLQVNQIITKVKEHFEGK